MFLSLVFQSIIWTALAGLGAGFVLGFLGAGGTVVGLPFFLYLVVLPPHTTLGTNAMGVFLIAAALSVYRFSKHEASLIHGVSFAVPGAAGILIGAQIGLHYPGAKLVFLLGFLLFAVAAWLYYLSFKINKSQAVQKQPDQNMTMGKLARMIPTAFAVGSAAGFFGIGGGFMIVPALALTANLELMQAAASSLLPIAAFAGLVGTTYLMAGQIQVWLSAIMLGVGIAGGFLGIKLSKRLGKTIMYRLFATFLVLLGLYILLR